MPRATVFQLAAGAVFQQGPVQPRQGWVPPLQQYSQRQLESEPHYAGPMPRPSKTNPMPTAHASCRSTPTPGPAARSACCGGIGGNVFNTNLKCAMNTPASVKAFQLMYDMTFKDLSRCRVPVTRPPFRAGGSACTSTTSVSVPSSKTLPFKWGIAPHAQGPGRPGNAARDKRATSCLPNRRTPQKRRPSSSSWLPPGAHGPHRQVLPPPRRAAC